MTPSPSVSVDVQDMLCAQALAVVANARAALPLGGRLEIHYNADDVRHDVLAWAKDRGDQIEDGGPERLQLTRRA